MPTAERWPHSSSEMGERIRQHDWQASPLGPPANWPAALRLLLDTILDAPGPMCILWGADNVQLYNDAHARLIGRRHPAELGSPACDTWGATWELLEPACDSARRGEARLLHNRHLLIERHDEPEDAWFDMALSPIRDSRGEIAGLLLCLNETSERMRSEARLSQTALRYKLSAEAYRLSEQRLQLALEASDLIGIWDWDVQAGASCEQVELLCRVSEQDYPSPPQNLSVQPFLAHIHSDDRARVYAAMQQCVAGNGTFAERYRLHGDDAQPRWAYARGRCHYDEDGRVLRFPGAVMDISRQHASELALRELNETLESRIQERTQALAEVYERLLKEMASHEQAQDALRQAQKMEAVGQLTGGIAHDFNNMLTGIIGGLDLIQRYIQSGRHDETQRFIDAAVTSANRAAALTHRLLAFARRQPLNLKRVELNALIDSMHDLLLRTLGSHIQIEMRLQDDLRPAHSDDNQLESTLLNLVINARDAMPDGGTLRIGTANVELERARQVGELPPGAYVTLTIADSGCGMTPKVLASAFEPFFTTKPIGQGTGLGLSMIYGFARQAGGHLQITSEPGAGTEVCLYLPTHAEAASCAPPPRATGAVPRAQQGECVLVVEDDPAVRLLVLDALEMLGYQALEAAEGSAAVALLESDQRIDLLVTDVGLPGMNGRQLADIARQPRPQLPVLFMTGYAERAASSGFLDSGMDMISKPFTIDQLAQQIRAMLAGDDDQPGRTAPSLNQP
ncbi:sensory box histidine kinase/response regulator [Stutzerimonas stutzeri TS44]|nr:sensory box histidine kinase/response regulator [Stutzerimonas stutzeri TS44]